MLFANCQLLKSHKHRLRFQTDSPNLEDLSGFLLLAETLKEADPDLAAYHLRGVYEQNVLGSPNSFQYCAKRDTTGYCLCHDPLRKQIYNEKYKPGRF